MCRPDGFVVPLLCAPLVHSLRGACRHLPCALLQLFVQACYICIYVKNLCVQVYVCVCVCVYIYSNVLNNHGTLACALPPLRRLLPLLRKLSL
jgi:hypothetical protein